MIDVIEMLNVAANLSRYLIASFQGEFEKAILKQSLDTCAILIYQLWMT